MTRVHNSLGSLYKTSPFPNDSDPLSLGRSPWVCVFNKHPHILGRSSTNHILRNNLSTVLSHLPMREFYRELYRKLIFQKRKFLIFLSFSVTLNNVVTLLRLGLSSVNTRCCPLKSDPRLLLEVYERKHGALVYWYAVFNAFLKCTIIFKHNQKEANGQTGPFFPQGTQRKISLGNSW